MAAESGKHLGSMSAFVPFFISSATFSYVSTGNLDMLVLICVVPQHPSLSFLFRPRDMSTLLGKTLVVARVLRLAAARVLGVSVARGVALLIRRYS